MKIKQRTGEWFAREHIDVNHRITPKQTYARRIHEEIDEHEVIVTPHIYTDTQSQTHFTRGMCAIKCYLNTPPISSSLFLLLVLRKASEKKDTHLFSNVNRTFHEKVISTKCSFCGSA